jgi:hypothetical protein
MRNRWQLIAMTGPPMTWGLWAVAGMVFDPNSAHVWLALMLLAIVMLLAAAVSYLHRLLYGEDGAQPIEQAKSPGPIEAPDVTTQ